MAIERKPGSFDAAYRGQMELYLRWLDRYERRSGEGPPIGLILCGEKNREQIELLQIDRGEIRVAEYLMELPPREMLEAKLHEAIRLARGKLEKVKENGRRCWPGCQGMAVESLELTEVQSSTFLLDYLTSHDCIIPKSSVTPDRPLKSDKCLELEIILIILYDREISYRA